MSVRGSPSTLPRSPGSQTGPKMLRCACIVQVNGAPALQVDLASNDPAAEAARRLAKQKAEDEQRKQNALPAWHLASTVSGEQTALGRKQQRNQFYNGFDVEDRKDDDDGDDDDYYAQYASLQTAEAAAASSSKPSQAPSVTRKSLKTSSLFRSFRPIAVRSGNGHGLRPLAMPRTNEPRGHRQSRMDGLMVLPPWPERTAPKATAMTTTAWTILRLWCNSSSLRRNPLCCFRSSPIVDCADALSFLPQR